MSHCEHCAPSCQDCDITRNSGDWISGCDHFNLNGVEWCENECPACAERQRIDRSFNRYKDYQQLGSTINSFDQGMAKAFADLEQLIWADILPSQLEKQ